MAVIAACTTTPPTPPAAAVTQISGKTCASAPVLSNALTLVPKRAAPTNNVVTDVGSASGCLSKDGKLSNYVVYALPANPENHTLTVGGQKEALRAFAPRVSLLDSDGGVVRTFEKDRLTNFGTTFSFQFRPSPQARYILVQSEPDMVGTVMSSFETTIVSNTAYAANPYGYGGTYTTQSGQEGSRTRSFSHEGKVVVYIQAVNGKIGLPENK
jgi:hypothetical protein